MGLANKLKALRKDASMTQKALAEMLGVTIQAVSNWEAGRANPSVERTKEIADIFGVPIDDLLSDEVSTTSDEAAASAKDNGEVVIYQTAEGEPAIDVRFEDETVWLTQQQMADLFKTSRTNIVEHIRNIYDEGELDIQSTCRNFRQVQWEGDREVSRDVPHFNLDMIISLGYRVRSKTATQFRRWATERLKEYMVKGFALDDERLKGSGGGAYWQELLERIRDIRSSEKMLYRQVLDLYATSVDYDPHSPESIAFFKMVQNKLHFAAHGHTAAEVIYERADAEKPFMGLTNFAHDLPQLADVRIAKNYLTEDELKILNRLVSGYFDFAEVQALQHNPMHMSDYVEHLDRILSSSGQAVLEGAGSVSHKQAMDKAEGEYRKYQVMTLSPVEEDYLRSVKGIEGEVKKARRNRREG